AEQRLPVTAQAARPLPGPEFLPVPGQQQRNEQHQFPGHVESDTISDQRGVSRQADDLWRDPFYRELRASPAMSASIRVSAYMPVMSRMTVSGLLRKPHSGEADLGLGRLSSPAQCERPHVASP